ncbi:MAG TPA: hypothetical protein VFU15_12585, partial [Bacteroidia bacterium]|nr:hypothetical protein [Bacteroidia bacterium]
MKKILVLFLLLSAFGSNAPASPVSLGEFLYTVPLKKSVTPAYAQTQWWHEYMEPSENEAFFGPLLDRIDSGLVDVYSPEFPFDKKISPVDVKTLL